MYTHKRGRETNIIVEIELGQFLGYQKDSKLKFVTISGKNQTKILVPFAPPPPPIIVILQKIRQILENTNKDSWAFSDKRIIGGPPYPPPPSFFIYMKGSTDLKFGM